MFAIIRITMLIIILTSTLLLAAAIEESKVFEWWDSGIISAEEADEMLSLLDEGNKSEACLLAEIYAQESCNQESEDKGIGQDSALKDSKKGGTLESVNGYVLWKGRTDSAGHLEKWHSELLVNFYRFSLRLGSQELLTYRHQAAEAHFGQISTRELHSQIPLDTLWGSALQYPLGNFRVGALLDTILNTQARLSYVSKGRPGLTLDAIYWHHFPEIQSAAVQIKMQPFAAAVWYQRHQDFPLIRLQLQNSEKLSYTTINYRASAYIHGDSLPEQSHLTTSIEKNRFWGTQTFALAFPQMLSSKFTVATRTMIPLDADTASTRIKLTAETGTQVFRSSLAATCLEASDGCPVNDIKLQGNLFPLDELRFFGSIKSRHRQGEGFGPPHLEMGPIYQIERNLAKLTLILPNATPTEKVLLRSETQVDTSPLEWSLVVTFRRKKDENIHPIHGLFQIKCRF